MQRLDKRILMAMAWLSFGALTAALVSQHAFGMLPCAWCVFQRVIYLAITLVSLLGLLGSPQHVLLQRIALLFVILLSVLGVAAAWHQWSVAAQSFSCDQTFADRFMTGSGLESALPWLFGIYATCMDAAVSILGLDFALWSLALFLLFFVASAKGLIASYRLQHTLD
jgi:protein dithiol:quinone oxidoreductase